MRLSYLLICCPLIVATFPVVTDLVFTNQQREQHPLVPALIEFGGPFVLAFLAAAFAQPPLSRARLVLLGGFAFGVGYLVSMKHVRPGGPGNLAPFELLLNTVVATCCLYVGSLVGTLVLLARKRSA